MGKVVCASSISSPWVFPAAGEWCYVVTESLEFLTPVQGVRGQQGIWRLSDDLKQRVAQATRDAIHLVFPDRYEELRNARTAVSWYGNPLIPPPITWHIRNVSQLAAQQTWQLIGGGSNKVVYRARTLRPYDSSGRRSVIVKKARQSSSELLAEISFLEHAHRT